MNYTEAVEFVHSRPRLGTRAGLDTIKRITSLCGDPQRKMRFIHIAGTNGKGSASTMLGEIFTAAGYKTGVYTSPFVTDFRERFKIDGEMIPEDEFVSVMDRLIPVINKLDSEGAVANQFEINTAVAFLWYAEKKCDMVVLEVGLGGKYDATNIIGCPECAVIMHIDLDHTDLLGNTVAEIAGEKCGIIKPGCNVVCYPEQYTDALSVIGDTCRLNGAKLHLPVIPEFSSDIDGNRFCYKGVPYRTRLIGAHQVKNAVTAIETALTLNIDTEFIRQGIERAVLPARQEILRKSPVILLDGAHNPDGMSILRDTVDDMIKPAPVAIIGMLKDKDYRKALSNICGCFSAVITVNIPNPRSLSAENLANEAREFCDCVIPAGSIEDAVDIALNNFADRPLVICGSLYLASEIRPILINKLK